MEKGKQARKENRESTCDDYRDQSASKRAPMEAEMMSIAVAPAKGDDRAVLEGKNVGTTSTILNPESLRISNPDLVEELGLPSPLPESSRRQHEFVVGAIHVLGPGYNSYDDHDNDTVVVGESPSCSPEISNSPESESENVATVTGFLVRSSSTNTGDSHHEKRGDEETGGSTAFSPETHDDSILVDAKILQDKEQDNEHMRCATMVIFLLIGVVIVLIVGLLGVYQNSDKDHAQTKAHTAQLSTLQRIKAEGVLKVPLHDWNHFFYYDSNGSLTGMGVVMYQAIAAAIGESIQLELVPLDLTTMFDDLQSGVLDVLGGATLSMERQVFQESSNTGFAQTIPYIFDGISLAGDPHYVQCAENDFDHLGDCIDLKICVGSRMHAKLGETLPRRNLVLIQGTPSVEAFLNQTCNVYTRFSFTDEFSVIREANYTGNFVTGSKMLSESPLGMYTRSSDPEFSDFVDSVIQSLFVAEKHNITRQTADSFPQTQVFGKGYKDMFRRAIAVGGNFGEIYSQHMESVTPRTSLNRINEKDSDAGLLYSLPLGTVDHDRGDISLGETIVSIIESGVLRCGVRLNRQGFATKTKITDNAWRYHGMDVDFCRAIGASLFHGSSEEHVTFVEIDNAAEGFQMLANHSVDIVAGAIWNLESDVREPVTGIGFSFSQPYFYSGEESNLEENLCLVTRQDDHDWASFVDWVVAATIHAEELGIERETSTLMPEVLLFGEGYKRMFRDAILTVGNYGSIYERNLEEFIPRGGRNRLNGLPNLGPKHYVVPGFI